MTLQPGSRITAPFLATPAEVEAFSACASDCYPRVVLNDGRRTFQSKAVFADQFASVEVLGDQDLGPALDAGYFLPFNPAYCLRLARQLGPPTPVRVPQVPALPHQIAVIHCCPESASTMLLSRIGANINDAEPHNESEASGKAGAIVHMRERHPKDASPENLCFYVCSIGCNSDGTLVCARYIEVNVRTQSGAVHISGNGRKEAHHFGDDLRISTVMVASPASLELGRTRYPVV